MAANDRDVLQGQETCDAGHIGSAFRPKNLKSNKRTGLMTLGLASFDETVTAAAYL
jgi:hypothetical protein